MTRHAWEYGDMVLHVATVPPESGYGEGNLHWDDDEPLERPMIQFAKSLEEKDARIHAAVIVGSNRYLLETVVCPVYDQTLAYKMRKKWQSAAKKAGFWALFAGDATAASRREMLKWGIIAVCPKNGATLNIGSRPCTDCEGRPKCVGSVEEESVYGEHGSDVARPLVD